MPPGFLFDFTQKSTMRIMSQMMISSVNSNTHAQLKIFNYIV